jgi:PAS domain S-box-containing protein
MAAAAPSKRRLRWTGFLPVAVFLVSSALLLLWWGEIVSAQRRAEQEHFETDARRVAIKIAERLEAYDEILRGAAGLFAASEHVTRDEFRRYVDALQLDRTYPEVQGVGFVLRIDPAQLAAHVQSVREEGFPDYAVLPEGTRDRYTSVVYLEPFTTRNRRAFGRDGFAEPVRRAAMEVARDTAGVATTRKVTLVQEDGSGTQAGVLTFFPVYAVGRAPGTEEGRRAALQGWVYSPLRMTDLMDRLVGAELREIRLEVFDGPGGGPEHLLYDSKPGSGGQPEVTFSLLLPVNQLSWTLRFAGGAAYVAGIRQRSLLVDAGVMTVLVMLLTGLSAAAVASWRSRHRALDLSRSLLESEARWRATFERAPVGIFTVDAEDRFLLVNRRYCEITGYTPEELRTRTRVDVVHPDDRARDADVARRVRSGELEVGTLERRGLRKDGTIFWGEITLSREPGVPGGSAHMIAVLEDVTARHEAEEKFREIAERSLAGILIVQDGKIAYANSVVAEMAGVSAKDFVGRSVDFARERIHPDDLPAVRAAAASDGAAVAGTVRPVTYRVVIPGRVRKLEQLARPIRHLGRPAMLIFLLDVTERERTEEELRKAQRLESLGLVAGGIAHDFNNLLTAVFGQVELARGHVAGGSPAAGELDVALSAVSRARDLTRQLLTFATGGAPERRILEVRGLLEDAARLGLGGSSLRARFELEPGLPAVEADEGQMSQMLNNLLVNARQATTGPGEVVIRARRRVVGEGEVPGLAAGVFVEISVKDHGHGIAPEVVHKEFDPFFTTRSSGTGLGLATSYSIVRRHGGHIGIESGIGEGTTVTVLLPAARGAPDTRAAPASVNPVAHPLRVLFMDDEPMVLKVGVKHGRKLGLEVETASDGAEAIEKFRRHREEGRPFDVVVLDLTVTGGMGGAQAIERLRAIDPGVVAIACSGYFDAAVMSEPGKFGFAGVLPKPYLATDLEQVLAAVTSGKR